MFYIHLSISDTPRPQVHTISCFQLKMESSARCCVLMRFEFMFRRQSQPQKEGGEGGGGAAANATVKTEAEIEAQCWTPGTPKSWKIMENHGKLGVFQYVSMSHENMLHCCLQLDFTWNSRVFAGSVLNCYWICHCELIESEQSWFELRFVEWKPKLRQRLRMRMEIQAIPKKTERSFVHLWSCDKTVMQIVQLSSIWRCQFFDLILRILRILRLFLSISFHGVSDTAAVGCCAIAIHLLNGTGDVRRSHASIIPTAPVTRATISSSPKYSRITDRISMTLCQENTCQHWAWMVPASLLRSEDFVVRVGIQFFVRCVNSTMKNLSDLTMSDKHWRSLMGFQKSCWTCCWNLLKSVDVPTLPLPPLQVATEQVFAYGSPKVRDMARSSSAASAATGSRWGCRDWPAA